MSREAFEMIGNDVWENFDEVSYQVDGVSLYGYGKYYTVRLDPIFKKISFLMDHGTWAELEEVGEEHEKSIIFLWGPNDHDNYGTWKEFYVNEIYPENPFDLFFR